MTTRRYQRVLIASSITLLISVVLLGLVGFMQWRSRQALRGDTLSSVEHVTQQFAARLQSRRGTLTLIRDTLNRRADLSMPQLEALGQSAVAHTQHMTGIGLLRAEQPPEWWVDPKGIFNTDLARLHRVLAQRSHLRGVWRVPSTLVSDGETPRPLLIMLEPLQPPRIRTALVGIFDLKPLLADFFSANLPPNHRVQCWQDRTLLYQSEGWQPDSSSSRSIVSERRLKLDAAEWTLRMQPATTHVVQTLSRFTVVLIVLSLLAGLGVIVVVWLLAARTWILQRAVARRTAALRHTTERLRQLAITDELTGLHNRRFFLDRWQRECTRAARYQRPLACLMIDIDGFKQVNDRFGHPTGDLVLKQVAQELKTLMRESDIVARLGGDEFVIALPETTSDQATAVAEKLREVRVTLPGKTQRTPSVKLSVGLGQLYHDGRTAQAVLKAADESLYTFKHRLRYT